MGEYSTALYDRVVQVTQVYFGPAADRFISRQVQNHLHKPPEDLRSGDLLQLIDWIRVAVTLITDDHDLVEEYLHQLRRLAQDTGATPHITQRSSKGSTAS